MSNCGEDGLNHVKVLIMPRCLPLDLPACNRGLRVESDLSLCSREPRWKASMSTGAASSRGSMANAKRFMKASYLGKAWNRAPSQGPIA